MVLFVGAPVNTRDTSLLNEWNDWPPKYSSTMPPAINANEIALVMELPHHGIRSPQCRRAARPRPSFVAQSGPLHRARRLANITGSAYSAAPRSVPTR